MHSPVDKMRTTGDRAFSVSYTSVLGRNVVWSSLQLHAEASGAHEHGGEG